MDIQKNREPQELKKQNGDTEELKKKLPPDEETANKEFSIQEAQEAQAKGARAAQLNEPAGLKGPQAAKEAQPAPEYGGKALAGKRAEITDQKDANGAKEAKEAREAKEAKEAKEALPGEKTPQGEKKAPEAQGAQKGEAAEQKAPEAEKKIQEAGKKAMEATLKGGGIEGPMGSKGAGVAFDQGAAAKGVEDLLRWTPTDANNASVQSPVPSSLPQTQTILAASQTAADSCPSVSALTANQPAEAQVGWASKAIGFAGQTLRSAFVGNFALWDPKVRDGLHKAFADWSDVTKAKGIDRIPPILDHVYNIIGAITGFTGPLGTVLGIVSYARYIPIPPIPAIGSALFVVSKVLQAINFILGIVQAVVALLRPIVTVLLMVTAKDPERRRKYQERLAGDLIDFATSGFSVAMSAGMGGKFIKGFREARKGGMSVLGSLRKGGGEALGALRGKWAESWGILNRNQIASLYTETLDEAYKNAMAWRLGQRVKVTERPQKGTTTYKFQDVRKLAKSREVFEARQGTLFNKTQASSYVSKRTGDVLRTEYFGNKALNQRAWDVGRMKEVGTDALRDAMKATLKKVPGQVGKEAKKGLQGAGPSPAPVAGPPCAPEVQASVERANKATEQSLKNNQTPLLKHEPIPPKKTTSAPAHLKAIQAQREVMKGMANAAQEHVLSAKAGQVEGKEIMKVAQEHRKGAEHAQQEVSGHLQGLQKEQQEVQKGRQKVQEGQKQQSKGKEGFGKVQSEGSRAKGAVPGGRVNRDEIPWYKRVFMWVVDQFEGAKAKVTEAMTGVVMKAVEGAGDFGDVGQKLQEADQQTLQQQQVLAQEPALMQKVQTVAQKEAQAATEGEQKGAQRIAENQKAEAAGQQALEETKKQEAALQKEEQQVKGDAAKYEATYGKSFDTLNKHADAAQAKDLTPLEIQLNEEVAALQEAVSKLLAAIAQHHGQVNEVIGQNVSKFREAAAKAKGEQGAKAAAQAESLAAQFRGQAAQTKAERSQQAEALVREAQGYVGRPADAAAIEAVSKLLGEAVAQARQFDHEKQSELNEIHQAFTQQYQALFQ